MVGITTRGRYALRIMIDIAEQDEGYVRLEDLGKRQEIPPVYSKQLVRAMVKGRLLESKRGRNGGLRLARDPKEYTVLEVLVCMEEELLLSPCAEEGKAVCFRKDECGLSHMWTEISEMLLAYLSQITLGDLIEGSLDMMGLADQILTGQEDVLFEDDFSIAADSGRTADSGLAADSGRTANLGFAAVAGETDPVEEDTGMLS